MKWFSEFCLLIIKIESNIRPLLPSVKDVELRTQVSFGETSFSSVFIFLFHLDCSQKLIIVFVLNHLFQVILFQMYTLFL